MNDRASHALYSREPDAEDGSQNESANPTFESVLQARISRRTLLRGALGAAGTVVFGGSLLGCSSGDDADDAKSLELGFPAVSKSVADALTVPTGYTATVLYRLGDPIDAATPDYANNGTDTGASFAARAGDHHDGMHFFGMRGRGAYDARRSAPRPARHEPRKHHPAVSCIPPARPPSAACAPCPTRSSRR